MKSSISATVYLQIELEMLNFCGNRLSKFFEFEESSVSAKRSASELFLVP